jgi:eukaryotic-like serine/threonine-protein kinase
MSRAEQPTLRDIVLPAPSRAIEAGTMITATVRLIEPLAHGGMADLWRAEHLGLGIRVAVKFITPGLANDATVRERFQREAHAAARIDSPHVVRMLDQGEIDDVPFIVMELLRGESLGQRLARTGTMTLRETADMVMQVAAALSAAHAAGVVHRDIKPDNIFLCDEPRGLIKLLDFGVAAARGARSLTLPHSLLGTPPYMSPEHVQGSTAHQRLGDAWALAVVAYEALTDRVPFDGADVKSVCEAIVAGDYLRASAIAPSLGRDVDAFFARAFHADPDKRFASTHALARELSRVANTRATLPSNDSAPPAVIAITAPRAAKRPRGTTNLLAALVGSLVLATVVVSIATTGGPAVRRAGAPVNAALPESMTLRVATAPEVTATPPPSASARALAKKRTRGSPTAPSR